MFSIYKLNFITPQLSKRMLRDRAGLVGREKDGMTIERRVFVIAHKDMDLIEAHEMHSDGTYKRVGVASADELGILICKWIWPKRKTKQFKSRHQP